MVLIPPPTRDPRQYADSASSAPQLRATDAAPKLNEETEGSMWASLVANLRDAFNPVKQAPLKLESTPAENDLIYEEEGLFQSLWGSIRDVFFPKKLPPLVLESKPVAVVDRMKFRRSPVSTALAVVIHGLAILLIAALLVNHVIEKKKNTVVIAVDTIPPMAPPKAAQMGGGGGQHGPTPVSHGSPPKFDPQPLVPPKAPPLEPPKIHIEPAVDVQKDVKMDRSLPNIGVANSPLVGLSPGNGSGGGLGSGNGNGIGPGSGGNMGGGPRRIGGGVSAPELIYKVEPEFSEEARKAKFAGLVLVGLWVDANGLPSHVHIVRGVGMGLDEKAVEAVKQYKFKPGMENGKPVITAVNVEVNFQIF
ncbi:MAG: energy transducer TonB [Acidobacteriaceae bacterium]|nr:energy transducer TonB [Acidobacteriaceae bacterium]